MEGENYSQKRCEGSNEFPAMAQKTGASFVTAPVPVRKISADRLAALEIAASTAATSASAEITASASATTTASAEVATGSTEAATTAGRTVLAGTRLVDGKRTAVEFLAVHLLNRGLRLGITAHRDKRETARTPGEFVLHQHHF